MLRRGEQPSARPGSPAAFMLFWPNRYSCIGITLAACGLVLTAVGVLA